MKRIMNKVEKFFDVLFGLLLIKNIIIKVYF